MSDFTLDFNLDHVDTSTNEKAKMLLLDSLAAVLSGNRTSDIEKVIHHFSTADMGQSVLGTGLVNHPYIVTVLQGMAMVSEELDEGNALAKGHPSCHFFPALLATAIEEKIDGKTFLEAFIVGYEINARAGSSIQLKKEIHPHGSWGMIGGGFALGKVLGFNAQELENLITLTSSFPMVSLWNPVLEGHQSRNLMIGMQNMNLLLLAKMAKAGVTSSPENVKVIYSSILGESFDERKLVAELGETFYLNQSYIKFHSYCRFCHAPMEGTYQLMSQHRLAPDNIESIEIKTYAAAARLNNQEPSNSFAAKFSIPRAISDYIYQNSGFNISATSITVKEYPPFTAEYPKVRRTKIVLHDKNGVSYEGYSDHASGEANDPRLKEKMIEKSRVIFTDSFDDEIASNVINHFMNLESICDISNVIEPLMGVGQTNVGC
ncbi:hypothetical protein AV656_07955 [Bhargavaea cecembensis]|uniref:2-methylcitrate dehydratase n=1 Tax=Bhargavaea cecembensis TaxID=394098 RepID=A0A163FJT0_9BACL|nr:MmgE/PrpD family protein [Bhargavaea cecembensis]KZE38827.1 hypothetical protein AV656_07955 [Bhargavaea cecembensis]